MPQMIRSVCASLAMMCLSCAVAFGQGAVTRSSLGGVVQDASGAVVPGASVVVGQCTRESPGRGSVTPTLWRVTFPVFLTR